MDGIQILLLLLIFAIGNVSWRLVMTMYSRRTGRPVNHRSDSEFFTYRFNWKEWLVGIAGIAAMFSVAYVISCIA